MEEIVYDTSKLIDFSRKGKFNLTGFTTIFNVIEYPKAEQFKELTVIYPVLEDYEEALALSSDLIQNDTPLPTRDILIASVCIRRNLTLCTKNNHFTNIKSIRKDFKLIVKETSKP